MEVANLDVGFRREFIPELTHRGYRVHQVLDRNYGRHKVVKAEKDGELHLFYLMFKRDFFGTYKKKFGSGSKGDSINVDCLEWCIAHKVSEIIIIYGDGTIYSIPPQHWMDYARKYGTFRTTKKVMYKRVYGKKIPEHETTASVDLRELNRWNK